MRIRFWCDSGANIKSCNTETFDVEDLGYTEAEWRALSDEQKQEQAQEWAANYLDIGFEEIG